MITPEKLPPEKVLIVDDIDTNVKLLEYCLRHMDLEIITANCGKTAIQAAKDNELALVLMDVQMPIMDGFTTAAEIHKLEGREILPIIFITAISRHDKFVLQGYESGAVDYLLKPISEPILRNKVKVFIELARQRDLIEKQRAELEVKVKELQHALDEIKILRGIIPICSSCMKVRNDKGYWEQVETYIENHSDVDFSHGICPDCLKKQYPDIADQVLKNCREDEKGSQKS